MLATMMAHLLDKAPLKQQEEGAQDPIGLDSPGMDAFCGKWESTCRLPLQLAC